MGCVCECIYEYACRLVYAFVNTHTQQIYKDACIYILKTHPIEEIPVYHDL